MTRTSTFSLSTAFASRPMLKSFVWSLSLHMLFLVVLFVLTGENRRDFMPITVLLAGDLPGEADGNDRTASTQPKRSKTGKARVNPGRKQDSAPQAYPAKEPEKSFSASDIGQKAAVPDPDTGAGLLRSLRREARFAGEEVTGADQDSIGQGENGEMGSDGRGGVGSDRGSGSGPGHGNGGGGNASYLSANFGYIRDRIFKGLSYPAQARRMGWKGRVTISFIISDSGCVESIKVVESSGHQILDAHAVKTIKSCQPFPRPPVRAEVVIPIVFKIG